MASTHTIDDRVNGDFWYHCRRCQRLERLLAVPPLPSAPWDLRMGAPGRDGAPALACWQARGKP